MLYLLEHSRLDHTDAKIHNELRGITIFEKAVENIRLCVKHELFTTVGLTPMKQNYDVIFDLLEFAIELEVPAINLSSYVPTGRGLKDYDLSSKEWNTLVIKWYHKTKEYKNKIRMQIHDPRLNLFETDSSPNSFFGLSGCLAGYSHCYILPNGIVSPCVMLPDIQLGNAKNEHIKDLIYKYQTSDSLLGRNRLKGKCGSCEYKYDCGGCRAVAYAYTGDLYESDPHCWMGDKTKINRNDNVR